MAPMLYEAFRRRDRAAAGNSWPCEDSYRESSEAWLSVLRDLERRGLEAPPLATGDGAPSFWKALNAVWPTAAGQPAPRAADDRRQ